MIYNICAGGIVINQYDEVALVTNDRKHWGFPKGRVNENESLINAAKREIHEETGITKLALEGKLDPYQRTQLNLDGTENPNIMKTINMFIYKTEKLELNPLDENIGEARWVDKEQVTKFLNHNKDKTFFNSIINKI